MTPRIVGDRFVASGARWIDLATGDPVRLHIAAGDTPAAELTWADRSAALARLRHPLINPLIDFGALDTSRRFEAYEPRQPLTGSGSSALRLLAHGVRFLQAHAIALSAPAADLALRPIVPGRPGRGRPFGLVLQRRAVLLALEDALDSAGPGGATAIDVCGGSGSGLRTLQGLTARAARLRGYLPVAIRAIQAWPWLTDALIDRHVCVLIAGAEGGSREPLVRFLARLGRASARRHIVITFARTPRGGPRALQIEPMGVRAMTSMIYVDPEEGPSPHELFSAARDADGSPGLFLSRLRAARFEAHQPRVLLVHEAVEPYVPDPAPAIPPPPVTRPLRRSGGALARAVSRGDDLAGRGRHMAASRLLSRAVRVLQGRGDDRGAAECAHRLGSLDLDRGRVASAAAHFERARELAPETPLALFASVGLGLAWLDDGRLLEAEALLRTAMVAAAAMGAAKPETEAMRALARSLYWQGRYDEAAAALRPIVDGAVDSRCPAALALAARVRLADGSVRQGTHLARRAVEDAAADGAARLRVSAHRAMAVALAACGDVPGAHEHIGQALAASRDAHQPLAALRVRATWLDILATSSRGATTTRRLAARMARIAGAAAIPRLLRFQIGIAVERAVGAGPDAFVSEFEERSGGRRPPAVQRGESNPVAELEPLIELCHAAPDDRSALDRLCAALLDRLRAASVVVIAGSDRRVLAQAGRAWHGEPAVAARALAGAAGETPDAHAPRQAAEPVRYGGEIVAAIAARWIAGTDLDPERASAVLKAGAMACAPSVRAVLDRVEPEPAGPAGTELLGQSAPIVALRDAVARAARAPFPVLIQGESGSGKELVALAIHRLGPRRDRRFCAVNCAALADELLEAELFGHTRGAFTGAVGERAGLFEEADGGTLFLDEIAELSPRAQAKLLRVLQDGEVRRVGENFPRRVDVRIVAATNRSLEQEAAAGRFRADLRFRLDVVRIQVPPLRDRAADIPLLATHFWNDASARVGSRATLSADALAALSRFDWPGNVRELQNAIAWMAVHSPRRGRIGAAGLPASLAGAAAMSAVRFDAAREEFERRFVTTALARANGHRARAAEAMGVTRQGLAKMMRRLGINDGATNPSLPG
jgi:DNA-binding NtrC family response regulator/tetratricopeptide (TPR) repeat protein